MPNFTTKRPKERRRLRRRRKILFWKTPKKYLRCFIQSVILYHYGIHEFLNVEFLYFHQKNQHRWFGHMNSTSWNLLPKQVIAIWCKCWEDEACETTYYDCIAIHQLLFLLPWTWITVFFWQPWIYFYLHTIHYFVNNPSNCFTYL